MRRFLSGLVLALFVFSGSVFANGLSLNSIGPRALGMGGAMVGLANDYTAIYWNPAGLAQMQGTHLGVFYTGVNPQATFKNDLAAIDAETETNIYPTGGLIGTMELMKGLTAGIGIYVPAGLGAQWNGDDLKNLSGGTSLDWESRIGLINFSPALAYQVSDQFSVGLAVNIYYALFDLDRGADMTGLGFGFQQYSESSTGIGYGVSLGALYEINEMISVGASFRTKADVDMDGSADLPVFANVPASFGGPWPTSSDFTRQVSWPLWIGGGIAVKPTEGLTLALDVQYSQWSESSIEFVTKYDEATWKGAFEPTDDHKFTLKWEDATQIRFGAEYVVNDMATIRAGFYTDPAPAPDETYNFLFPSIDYNGITGGATITVGGVPIDLAAEYLIGTDRKITQGADNVGGTHGMNIFAFSIGTGFEL